MAMIHTASRRFRRSGAAAIEFALLAPLVLVPILLGVWEVGRRVEVQQLIDNAAREGARQAAICTLLHPTTPTTRYTYASDVQSTGTNYLTRNGLTATGINVQVSNLSHPSAADPYLASQLDQLQVTVQLPFNNVKWVVLGSITGVTTLNAQVTWYSMRDINVTVSTTLPY
jgi:Flp pilus assembly protein TadG